MKSLLVEALRAANEADAESGRSASHAAAGAQQTPKHSHQIDGEAPLSVELELLDPDEQTGPGEPDRAISEMPAAEHAKSIVLPTDAGYGSANDSRRTRTLAAAAVTGNAGRFERLSVWTPVLCLLLAACSIAAFSGWTRAAGGERESDLSALVRQAYTSGGHRVDHRDNEMAERFAFTTTHVRRMPARVSTIAAVADTRGEKISITRVPTARRRSAGLIDADEKTFSSLGSAYNAYLAGDVTRAYIDGFLLSRISADAGTAELDIKLLLQRNSESAALHFALGTLLARGSRWPEARIALARAAELNAAGTGKSLR